MKELFAALGCIAFCVICALAFMPEGERAVYLSLIGM